MPALTRGQKRAQPARLPLPHPGRIGEGFARLARENALQTLVRGALPAATLKRLLKDALPRGKAREMPPEIWASLAAGFAYESPEFGMVLAEALQDRLAWDREPATLDGWWSLVVERPLEALWMAALSDAREVRKEFAHIAQHCIENYRASPECAPPSWQFVEGLLAVQAETVRDLRDAEKAVEGAERRYETERERLEELRDELKRLRRENSELRAEKAQAERRAGALASEARAQASTEDARHIEDLERRLRKSEKEREHVHRELERARAETGRADGSRAEGLRPSAELESEPAASPGAPDANEVATLPLQLSISGDPNPRRRVVRQILRKLFKKGKIGASHTHEDNVYRGVADHEKGIAKEAMDLLYREGFLLPKPTTTDPHVSLSPERTGEIRSIIAGEIANPRLQRFVEP